MSGSVDGFEPYPGYNAATDGECLICGNLARAAILGDNGDTSIPFTLLSFTDTQEQMPIQLNVQAHGISCNIPQYPYADLQFYLNNEILYTGPSMDAPYAPADESNCVCDVCDPRPLTLQFNQNSGIPGYVLGGLNSFKMYQPEPFYRVATFSWEFCFGIGNTCASKLT